MPDFSSNNDNDNDNNHASASSITMDGSDDDSALSRSEFLTREEVLRRRSRRLKRLASIYKDHYWALMEELNRMHKQYYWKYGKSPFLDDHDVGGEDETPSGLKNRCQANGCKTKAMALTRFCHSHILADPKQVLYKGCTYVSKSSPTGPILCMKPILRSVVPSLCSLHLEKAEKNLRMALKKGGYHNAATMSKVAPKCNVIVAESVRQIQSKRRAAQKAHLDTAELKEHH